MKSIVSAVLAAIALLGACVPEKAPSKLFEHEPIVDAVICGNLEGVKEELSKGVDVNTTFESIPQRESLYEYVTSDDGPVHGDQIANLLLENGADVNFLYPSGYFPLMSAAGYNDIARCESLIQHGADINMRNKEGSTALDEAARSGACDTLRYFMEKGLEPTHETLLLAIEQQEYEAAHIIAAHLDENGGKLGISPILRAAVLGDTQAVVQHCKDGALTEKNWDVVGGCTAALCSRDAMEACFAHGFSLETEERDSPLILAARYGNLDTLDYILKQYPEEAKRKLDDALSTAVCHEQTSAVQYLLNTGHRFSLSDMSVLLDASRTGNIPIVKLLLDSGQKISHEAVMEAITNSLIWRQKEPIKLLLPLETWTEDELLSILMLSQTQEHWELCLSYGAKPTDEIWAYLLSCAAERGDLQAVTYLLSKGADPSYSNGGTSSALISAVHYGFYDVAEVLIQNGADVNLMEDSYTPLHFAAMYSTNLTRLLLENGADVNIQTGDGITPLMYVIMYGNPKPDTVSLLLQAGADTTIQNEDGETVKDLVEKSGSEALKACFS